MLHRLADRRHVSLGPFAQFKVLGFLLVLLCAARVPVAVAFDLEDYATTYRATRDAWPGCL